MHNDSATMSPTLVLEGGVGLGGGGTLPPLAIKS